MSATSPRTTSSALPTSQRSNRVTSNSTTMKETTVNKKHKLQTAEDAEKYLISKGWHPDIGPTVESVAQTALLLSTCGPAKEVTDGLRAIGLILREAAFKLFRDAIIEDFLEKAQIVTADLIEIGKKVDRQQNLALNADEFLGESTKELKETTEALKNAAECMARTGEESRIDIDKATERLTERIEAIPDTVAPTVRTQYQAPSYASITAAQSPNSAKISRDRLQARQILLDKAPGLESHGIASLTEAEAVAKGNEAIRLTFGENEVAAREVKVVGAKILRNGGVVLEMNSEEAVRVTRERRSDLEKNLGGTSVLKNREWATLAEYVPVKHDVTSAPEREQIAKSSGLDATLLVSTRWIKPVHKRTHNQQAAHLIARWATPEAANEAIQNGVIISGKRCNVRKLDPEPRRCLNCQKHGTDHLAANCPSKTICGTCGGDHRTSQCFEENPAAHSCVNCRVRGHASWSRDCPEFTKRRLSMQSGEARFKFYTLENEDWTWERADGQKWRDTIEGIDCQEGLGQQGGGQTARSRARGQSAVRDKGGNPPPGSHDDGWNRQAQLTSFGFEQSHANQIHGAPRSPR